MKRLIRKSYDQEEFDKVVRRNDLFDLKACINKFNSSLKITKTDFNDLLNMPMSDQVNEFAGYNLEEIIGSLKSAIRNVTKLKDSTEFNEPYLKEIQSLYDNYNTKFDDNRAKVKELFEKIDTLNSEYLSKINNEL